MLSCAPLQCFPLEALQRGRQARRGLAAQFAASVAGAEAGAGFSGGSVVTGPGPGAGSVAEYRDCLAPERFLAASAYGRYLVFEFFCKQYVSHYRGLRVHASIT